MNSRNGHPLLADGTTLDDLVSTDGERTVLARIMSDPEIYELELEQIFGRTWLFVAHESEVPEAGSFVTRSMGRDSVIVTRDTDDEVHVVLNACSHRGTQVCNVDRGRADMFRCPYHGWVFDGAGQLLGALAEREAYPNGLDKDALGLRRARVDRYLGLVFATWDHDGPSLEEHLGELRFYMAALFGGSDGGMEVVGPPQRWIVPANWKLAADNFSVDSYHTLTTHRSIVDIGLSPALEEVTMNNIEAVTDPRTGHGILMSRMPMGTLPRDEALAGLAMLVGLPADAGAQLERNLSPDQLRTAFEHFPGVGNFFPNLGWVKGLLFTEVGGTMEPAMTIRVFHPRAPDATEIWSWAMVHAGAPDDLKDSVRRTVARAFGTAGLVEQDDGEIWSRIQRAVSGTQGRRARLRYASHREPDPAWSTPGIAYIGFPTDDQQWSFYLRWRELMGSEPDRTAP
jgi:phenylpropionate dioxygenase-like ring-hydroxylating dioxygenase large terminal subunit